METEQPILKYFRAGHLPSGLREVSDEFRAMAHGIAKALPDGPEKSTCLRKLLEAKDCAVRATLDEDPNMRGIVGGELREAITFERSI